jgi:hypothetical protein
LAILALWFLGRRFLNDHILFLHFCNYLSSFEEVLVLYLNKLTVFTQELFVPRNWPAGFQEDFKKDLSVFYSFAIISIREWCSSSFDQT